jgi:hypothetical protein
MGSLFLGVFALLLAVGGVLRADEEGVAVTTVLIVLIVAPVVLLVLVGGDDRCRPEGSCTSIVSRAAGLLRRL